MRIPCFLQRSKYQKPGSTITEVGQPNRIHQPSYSATKAEPRRMMVNIPIDNITGRQLLDELSARLRQEALMVESNEPELAPLLRKTVLAPSVVTFEDAVASSVCHRLLLSSNNNNHRTEAEGGLSEHQLRNCVRDAMDDAHVLELGHTMSEAMREDALAVCRRDPAMDTILEVVLMAKGYAALVAHRAAFRLYPTKKFTALYLQSQASAAFGLDIHPCAQIGMEVMLDHGTGIVIGETATVGDGTTILHGVTLGGTGKEAGDRHPKVGRNVFIGAGTCVLGNIRIGHGAKIGAGSVVLRPIPKLATAVGAPARIIGRTSKDSNPGSDRDDALEHFQPLHMTVGMKRVERRLSIHLSPPEAQQLLRDSFKEEVKEDHDNDLLQECPLCPWKTYFDLAKFAPPRSVTLSTMLKLMAPEGCSMEEIGNAFFELDTEAVGHILLPVFREKAQGAILENTTTISEDRVGDLLSVFFSTT